MIERLQFLVYRVTVAYLGRAPLGVARASARLIARALYLCVPRLTGYALANLRVAFPERSERDRRRIALRSYCEAAHNVVDVARSFRWGPEELQRHVAMEGRGHLDAALARGNGAILMGGHVGNFELAASIASLGGIPLSVVSKPVPNVRIEAHLSEARSRYGAEFIHPEKASRPILRALRAGRCVVLLIDQRARRSLSVLAPLFGRMCPTSQSVATLARRTGCAVVPFYVLPDGRDHHTVHLMPPLERVLTGDREEDIRHATAGYNLMLETVIRRHPEHWLWSHRRFRRRESASPLESTA